MKRPTLTCGQWTLPRTKRDETNLFGNVSVALHQEPPSAVSEKVNRYDQNCVRGGLRQWSVTLITMDVGGKTRNGGTEV
jgi:hypothetical protein